jgi:hypothetical protein
MPKQQHVLTLHASKNLKSDFIEIKSLREKGIGEMAHEKLTLTMKNDNIEKIKIQTEHPWIIAMSESDILDNDTSVCPAFISFRYGSPDRRKKSKSITINTVDKTASMLLSAFLNQYNVICIKGNAVLKGDHFFDTLFKIDGLQIQLNTKYEVITPIEFLEDKNYSLLLNGFFKREEQTNNNAIPNDIITLVSKFVR